MKNFSIDCYDKNKSLIGTQNVSMSNEEKDQHNIRFLNKEGEDLLIIDVQNGELILDNKNGTFNNLTLENPIAKIKVSNIQLDYEDNLTFTLDGAKNVYKISGNTIMQKKGAMFNPVIKFEQPLDIVFSNTLFKDIENKALTTNGLPYQMFDALSDNSIEGLSQYQSSNKLLHLVKFESQLYVGRGHKLIPMNKDNLNMYKMGDSSVLGFTTGRNNGISGKQSSGIAFNLSEPELDLVANFITNGETATFKNAEDFKNNDIDYTKVYKQTDLSKTVDLNTHKQAQDNDSNDSNNNSSQSNHIVNNSTGKDDSNNKNESSTDNKAKEKDKEASKEESDKKDKPAPPPEKKEEAKLNVAAWSTVGAFALGMLIISGVFVGPFAFLLFGLLFVTAGILDADFTITYYKKNKLTKEEKLNKKLDKNKAKLTKALNKQKKLEKNIAKQSSYDDKTRKSVNKLNNKINHIKQKIENNVKQLNALNNTPQNNSKNNNKQDDEVAKQVDDFMKKLKKGELQENKDTNATNNQDKNNGTQTEESIMNDGNDSLTNDTKDENTNEKSEDITARKDLNQENTSTSTQENTNTVNNNNINNQQQNTEEVKPSTTPTKPTYSNSFEENYESVKQMVADAKNSSNTNADELNKLFSKVNEAIKQVCPDGLSADKIDPKYKDAFQKYVDYRNIYNYKELMEESLSDCSKSTPLYKQYSSQLEEANTRLKQQLSKICKTNATNLENGDNTNKPKDDEMGR